MRELEQFPRVKLGVLPTPIHRLEGISAMLGTNVYVKRDDLTGLGLGGNKVRKLEFLLADAREKGAEVVFTTGGAQSNHAMLTAAAANKLGMKAILILKKRGVTDRKGNVLLEHLLGTDVRFMDTDDYQDIYDEMDRVGKELGMPYYKIPVGGSNCWVPWAMCPASGRSGTRAFISTTSSPRRDPAAPPRALRWEPSSTCRTRRSTA